ncbi:hypothetical protein [Haliscomenobacter hydrossis]|uniref:O-antigen polysaccharide polymerase Wzy n=1 Tax=Haliscomenobacter hydrossis (strain ATCC 27775 / DSM 1100 / LMG 10767 / O) TaxID=760192 RepID=F4L451_HALH1|nr:hypothetical protein [Haliscomenobacter hydrossis]AEE50749.1 hypothetical protein Halhy_2884 [Haliscomenobacter hydrossis DSM 1100]
MDLQISKPNSNTSIINTVALLVFLPCLLILSTNTLVTLYSFLVILVVFNLLWKPGHPPIIFLCLALQWVQASTRIFQANLAGLTLKEYDHSSNAEPAVLIALTSLLLLGVIIGGLLKKTSLKQDVIYNHLEKIQLNRLVLVYLVVTIIFPLLNRFASGGLAQIVGSLQTLKWALYSLLVLASIKQGRYQLVTFGIFIIELLLGFISYFSSYRDVLFVTLITYFIVHNRIVFKNLLLATVFVVLLFNVFVVWTGIKTEYRNFLNTGSSQSVNVSSQEALSQLGYLLSNYSSSQYSKDLQSSLDRLQYSQMTQYCMDYVPIGTPHTNGQLWVNAVSHVFMPRILFPDKAILDDTALARKYTGFSWYGAGAGTSISLGYVAESYVDFGYFLFFIPVVFLGMLIGTIYKFLINEPSKYIILNLGMIIPILLPFQLLEISSTKLVGGIIMNSIVFIFVIRLFIYPLIFNFIYRNDNKCAEKQSFK